MRCHLLVHNLLLLKKVNRSVILLFSISLLFLKANFSFAQVDNDNEWKPLFNGRDLTGWDTYLRAPEGSEEAAPIGLNKDPYGVFTVNNGAIRISGQVWGAIITKEEFENYHLRFQTKWGEKKWPPRENALRDGGLLFHSSGPHDYGSKCWMRSNEMQIQEGEIGDFHNVGAGTAEFQLTKTTVNGDKVEQYDPFAEFKRYDKRVYRSGNFESPHGEWTTGEMVARGADAVFIVNGFVVNRLYNMYRKDLQQQTTRGKIQFQSESAEVYHKNIEIRPVSFDAKGIPVLVSDKKEIILSSDQQGQISIVNQGAPVEIIAAELLGKQIERFIVKLPPTPFIIKKGETITLPLNIKPGSKPGDKVKFKLETVFGPVPDFEVILDIKR